MFISIAHAAEEAIEITTDGVADVAATAPQDALMWNVGLILVMVAMFYILLIRPQQKRFKEHQAMVDALKPGDKVITSGGLIGTIDTITDGNDEVVIDLGDTKVTAVRHTLQVKNDKAEDKK